MKTATKQCTQNIQHLNRIQGQIEALKKYIEDDKCCGEIAQLSTSIAKSFDTLRSNTLKNFILNEFVFDNKISAAKIKKMERIINLYKK